MRAYTPKQLFGLIQNVDVMTMPFYGFTGPRRQRPLTSGVPDDQMIDKHRTKIQGGHSTLSPPSSQSMTAGADLDTDTSAWQHEIDERVYRLYGLTREEIKLVEDSRPEAAR